MVNAVWVHPKDVLSVWAEVGPLLRKAMERGDLGTFDSLQHDILIGNALLWLALVHKEIKGAAVSQFIKTEKSKVCMIHACGGKGIRNWLHLISSIEQYARSEGCNCIRLMGRKGWARVLKDYRATKIVLERQL